MINKFDNKNNSVPEYKPYSLVAEGFVPMDKWRRTKQQNQSSNMFEVLKNQKIETPKDYIKAAEFNSSLYLEINDNATGKTQLLRIPEMFFLRTSH